MGLFRQISLCAIGLLMSAPNSRAQEGAPLVLGGFETQGSVTAGYRFTDIKGRKQKFLKLFDLQKGFRLMDFSLFGRAQEGASPFADRYSFTLSGLGGDPYPGGQLTVSKDKLYDLRVSYRQSYYYWDRDDSVALPTALNTVSTQTFYVGHGLTTNHNWATVRRFASVDFLLYATNNLRFGFEFQRNSRDGMFATTRNLEYTGDPSVWAAFARTFPFYIAVPVNELSNRITGSMDYTLPNWNFHYRLGYQTFLQNLTGNNPVAPEASINTDIPAGPVLLISSVSYQDFRRLKTPVSEFSYDGRLNSRIDVRGGYIFYRYAGPASSNAAYSGTGPTTSTFTFTTCTVTPPATSPCAPFSISTNNRGQVTEPNHVIDQGFSLSVTDWASFHADYRYQRFTEDAVGTFHTVRDITTILDGSVHNQWTDGTHLLSLNLEFIPSRSLVLRTGVRLLKRDIEGLEDGVSDPMHTRRIKTAWPTLSVFYKPSKIFSVRGDFQSITNGASYTQISPHTDIGSRFVFRFQPLPKLSFEDNLVVRNRRFVDTNFQNNIRSNAFAVSYAFSERISAFGGFSYDSYLAADSVKFGGSAPFAATWRDQFINRVWQGGLSVKAPRFVGFNLSGNFVRTTGSGQMTGEPATFGPVKWPMITGTVWADFPKAGRLSLDLQRTYYIEQIVPANNFQGSLLTIRWTRDF